MDLSAKDIEYKLVTEHGLEEDLYMERFAETGLPVRRRVKIISQRPIKGNKHGMPREDELVPRLHYNAATHGLTHAEVLEQVHGHRSSTLDMTNVSAPDEYRVHASNGHDPMVKSEEED